MKISCKERFHLISLESFFMVIAGSFFFFFFPCISWLRFFGKRLSFLTRLGSVLCNSCNADLRSEVLLLFQNRKRGPPHPLRNDPY